MPRSKCKRKQFPHFIDRIGVELEGGFARGRSMGGTFHQDISVEINDEELNEVHVETRVRPSTCTRVWSCNCAYCQNFIEDDMAEHPGVVTGEYVSDPLNTWRKYTNFVKRNYPDVVNASCGMHVHASFNNFIYMSGMLECATEICDGLESAYTAWGKAELNRKEWSRMKGRLEGHNSYCRKGHNAVSITGAHRYPGYVEEPYVDDDRYHWLNFESLEKHGTIECRMLPAFDTAEHLIEATNILFNVYRRVLYKYIRGSGIVHRTLITEGSLIKETTNPLRDVTVSHDQMVGVEDTQEGMFYNMVVDVEQIGERDRPSSGHIGPHDNAGYPYKVKTTQTRRGLKKKIKTPPPTSRGRARMRRDDPYAFPPPDRW